MSPEDKPITEPTISMIEFPFWRDGMTYREYEKERTYFYEHIEDWKRNTYTPLWKLNADN